MSFNYDWRQFTSCKVQTVGVNCPAVQWNSLVLGSQWTELFAWIDWKSVNWKCKPFIRKSEVVICLYDQVTIAWLTSTRGVYSPWYDGLLSSETDESPFNNLFQPKLAILVFFSRVCLTWPGASCFMVQIWSIILLCVYKKCNDLWN